MGRDGRWVGFMDPAAIETADTLDMPAFVEKWVDHGIKFLHIEHTEVFSEFHHEFRMLVVVGHFLSLCIGFLSL